MDVIEFEPFFFAGVFLVNGFFCDVYLLLVPFLPFDFLIHFLLDVLLDVVDLFLAELSVLFEVLHDLLHHFLGLDVELVRLKGVLSDLLFFERFLLNFAFQLLQFVPVDEEVLLHPAQNMSVGPFDLNGVFKLGLAGNKLNFGLFVLLQY